MPQAPGYINDVLCEAAWQAARNAHANRLKWVLEPYLAARSRGVKDPVMDFLFEYYRFRPSHLLRWSPGFGTALQGPGAKMFLNDPTFTRTRVGIALAPDRFPARRRASACWIRDVLRGTEANPPFLGCHGMHEWAMVYRADRVRHDQVPLRLSPEEIAAVVEARPVVCSHFDAFRFFTPAARPLNRHHPTRAAMTRQEQPGCLHTNMDLYRWAYRFSPWIPADLIADAFLLACRIREIDMRASPYDLHAAGLDPIPVETPEGRRLYRQYQQRFAEEAAPLRARLLATYGRLLTWLS